MRMVLSKRWILCALLGWAVYLAALALAALLILRGALREEYAVRGCALSAFAAALVAVLVCRLVMGKGAAVVPFLCGCTFLLPAALVGSFGFGGLVWGRMLPPVLAAVSGACAASVLARRDSGRKKPRGRRRSANR